MMSEKWAQKFHTDDASLSRSGYSFFVPRGKFASTNQKHDPDPGSDAPLVWNFCAHFSDVISRGNQCWCREMSPVFSSYLAQGELGIWQRSHVCLVTFLRERSIEKHGFRLSNPDYKLAIKREIQRWNLNPGIGSLRLGNLISKSFWYLLDRLEKPIFTAADRRLLKPIKWT